MLGSDYTRLMRAVQSKDELNLKCYVGYELFGIERMLLKVFLRLTSHNLDVFALSLKEVSDLFNLLNKLKASNHYMLRFCFPFMCLPSSIFFGGFYR